MMRAVIMGAGKGKRMGPSELPKVLHEVLGKPMLQYVIDAVMHSGVDAKPVVVVGYMAEKVKEACNDRCDYVLQTELKGTGDAVLRTRPLLEGVADDVMVLNGDHPFTDADTLRALADAHRASSATLTMGTVTTPDFEGWRKQFADFGRVVRDAQGRVQGIVEAKDASPDQLALREVNPNFFCFKAAWLWKRLETLTNANAQGEYYVTDVLAKAVAEGVPITTVPIAPEDAIGINTIEQLRMAEELMRSK